MGVQALQDLEFKMNKRLKSICPSYSWKKRGKERDKKEEEQPGIRYCYIIDFIQQSKQSPSQKDEEHDKEQGKERKNSTKRKMFPRSFLHLKRALASKMKISIKTKEKREETAQKKKGKMMFPRSFPY